MYGKERGRDVSVYRPCTEKEGKKKGRKEGRKKGRKERSVIGEQGGARMTTRSW